MMTARLRKLSEDLKERSPDTWQLITFFLLGLVTTVVDWTVFALGNWVLFTGYRQAAFRWWLLDYGVENGGKCAFLAMALSFAVSQVVNFFLQRSRTFSSGSNVIISFILYVIMVLACFGWVLWLPACIGGRFYAALGETAGAIAVKCLAQFTSALIQYPICKYIVMR